MKTSTLINSRTAMTVAVSLAVGVTLMACGGGGGGGGGGIADISGSGVVSGPVDGFGSIIANGVRMDVSRATITDDGVVVAQSGIDVGDTVTMRGTLNDDGTGAATTVITDEFLKGPVDSVDTAGNQFVAMGQTVNVDLGTVFSGVTLATLQPGDLVEVHGSLDANDQVRATRVEFKPSVTEYEVTGFIDSINTGAWTLVINGLAINYAAASVDTEGGGPLAAGMYVDVGAASAPSGGVLVASSVEQEDRVPGVQPGDEAEIEGIISDVLSPTRFVLNGFTVEHGASTQFESGSAAGLVLNARVEVEGRFDSAGILQASEIEVEQELNVRIATTVDAVDSSAGTLMILGKLIRTNAETQFEDARDDIQPFHLSDLSPGDYVEVRAFIDSSGLVASRVERDDNANRLELRGPVDSDNNSNTLVILGIDISTDVNTQYEDLNDNSISANAFFTAVGPGDVVEIRQDAPSGPIVADEASIEELVP